MFRLNLVIAELFPLCLARGAHASVKLCAMEAKVVRKTYLFELAARGQLLLLLLLLVSAISEPWMEAGRQADR